MFQRTPGCRLTRRRFIEASACATLGAAQVFAPAVWNTRSIKLGYVSPLTGSLAAFAEADNLTIISFMEAMKHGLKIGGRSYDVEVLTKDSGSDPIRAAEVAKALIVDDRVDLMLVGGMPQTVNPVSSQCEVAGLPCVSSTAPWQPYLIGRQDNPADVSSWRPFKYTYHFFWGLEDVLTVFTGMWGQLNTNRIVGGLFANDGDGNVWADKQLGSAPVLGRLGYKLTDPGRYANFTNDFAVHISAFKEADCEIITGPVLPVDFVWFWNQANQNGFRPKMASIGKAILFPDALQELGKNGNNLSSEVWWSPSHPFRSSLNGMSAKQVAHAYQLSTGKQWIQPIGFTHALFEVAADVLRRTDTIEADSIVRAIRRTNLETLVGHIEWDGKGLPPFAQINIAKTRLVGGQWRLQDGSRYDIVIVDNTTAPQIPLTGEVQSIA